MTTPIDRLAARLDARARTVGDLRRSIRFAVRELVACHYPDESGRQCVTCGGADGSWPCVSRMVADDLRKVIPS